MATQLKFKHLNETGATAKWRWIKGIEESVEKPSDFKSNDKNSDNTKKFVVPATEVRERIVNLHHDIRFFLTVIVIFVSYMLYRIICLYKTKNWRTLRVAFAHHTLLEKVWTYLPTLVLIFIAAPSFSLLYSIDELNEPKLTVKAIGNQWFWAYETVDMKTGVPDEFTSYRLAKDDLKVGLRLLEVDNKLYLPIETNIRRLISGADVIHSWAVPALGVKRDAIPGRLNQVSLRIERPGTYYGQCSELCGINHSFMPVVIQAD